MVENYRWVLITIPLLAVLLYHIDRVIYKKTNSRGNFIWILCIICGLFLVVTWFLKPHSQNLIRALQILVLIGIGIEGLVINIGKALRLKKKN